MAILKTCEFTTATDTVGPLLARNPKIFVVSWLPYNKICHWTDKKREFTRPPEYFGEDYAQELRGDLTE
jgi:hypothetical protein